MPVFTRWDVKAKVEGEPVSLEHTDVAKVVEMILTTPKGRRHGCRVYMKDDTTIDLCVPAGEVQDRLNDAIASVPKIEDVMSAQAPPAFSSGDQDDDEPLSGAPMRDEDEDDEDD